MDIGGWLIAVCVFAAVAGVIGLICSVSPGRESREENPEKPITFITWDLKKKTYSVHYGMSRDGELPAFTVSHEIGKKE